VLPHLPLAANGRMADAGSGAGLPGIPLAIARPHWRVTLAEASQKKAAFLRQAAIELHLSNIEVHEGRVEAWRPQALFEVVISRAFAALAEFVAACRHLLTPAGALAAMTGAAPATLASECRLIALRVPLLDAQRHLVLCPASSL
jgi:16S rRNA (guanine527-N7)-methyltransferase